MVSLDDELFAAELGQFVEACFSIAAGRAPFRANPSAPFEALKSSIQRTVINKKRIPQLLLDGAGDPLAVLQCK